MGNFDLLKAFGQLSYYDESILDQEYLIANIIESTHFKQFSPSTTFERSFWRRIIDQLESSGEEVDERIYTRYLALLPAANASNNPYEVTVMPSTSYTTYLIEPPAESVSLLRPIQLLRITLKESQKTIERGTTGFRTWKPSLFLVDHLLHNPDLVRAQVLELGCGVGLLGTTIRILQCAYEKQNSLNGEKYSIHMTDIDEDVLSTCRSNLLLPPNELDDTGVQWSQLDWNDALPGAPNREPMCARLRRLRPTVVFGADLVYDLSIIPALSHLLAILCQLESKPTILLTITVRRQETMDTFLEETGNLHLRIEEIPLPPFSQTVFANHRDSVDSDVVIKMVKVSVKFTSDRKPVI